jgi:hypothetical protein
MPHGLRLWLRRSPPAKPPTPSNISAGTANRISDSATADTSSNAINAKQATRLNSHSSRTPDHSEVGGESNLTDGADKSRRDGDGSAPRALAPAVSSGVQHLALGATGSNGIAQSLAPTQMLRPSGSTNRSLHGASRQSELESTSALRFNTGDANTSSVRDRNFAESNNRNASGPNAPKVSGIEHGKAEALSDHIGVAESGSTNRPAPVESSASVSSRSSEEIKSVASSLAMSHETPGDLRAEDLTASIPSSANEALANAVATDASEDANQPDEPVAEIALVGIQGVPRELTEVSVVRSAATQPDTSGL